MKELIGRTITAIFVNDDQSTMIFETNKGLLLFDAWGDCCSETWFADMTGVYALIGGKVINIEEVNMDNYNIEDGRTRQEHDQAYGYKITTNKGYASIVFRNSSNGYYGGDVGEGMAVKTMPLRNDRNNRR